jgi:hypothetical protein
MSTPNRLSSSDVAANDDDLAPRCEDDEGAKAEADPKRATIVTAVFMVLVDKVSSAVARKVRSPSRRVRRSDKNTSAHTNDTHVGVATRSREEIPSTTHRYPTKRDVVASCIGRLCFTAEPKLQDDTTDVIETSALRRASSTTMAAAVVRVLLLRSIFA